MWRFRQQRRRPSNASLRCAHALASCRGLSSDPVALLHRQQGADHVAAGDHAHQHVAAQHRDELHAVGRQGLQQVAHWRRFLHAQLGCAHQAEGQRLGRGARWAHAAPQRLALLLAAIEPALGGVLVEVLGDLLGSVAVIVAGLIIMFTGWMVVDQLASIAIAIMK